MHECLHLYIYLYELYCRLVKSLTFLLFFSGSVEGVLWLSMISEFVYISLLGMGFLLMWMEILCSHKELHALKINAFAALCTVLSGMRITLCSAVLWFIRELKETFSTFLFKAFLHILFFPSHLSLRSNWDGGPHDVHHSFPADCDCRT